MSKTITVSIRLTEEERDAIAKHASGNGLSLSEYIRIRMIEKEQAPDSYKTELTTFGLIAYYTLGAIAKKRLTPEEIAEARARANSVLKKWRMSEED